MKAVVVSPAVGIDTCIDIGIKMRTDTCRPRARHHRKKALAKAVKRNIVMSISGR